MAKKSRFTEEQIIHALREVDAGARLQDAARKLGVTEATLCRWRSKCGGMEVSDAKRLKPATLDLFLHAGHRISPLLGVQKTGASPDRGQGAE